MSDKEKSEAPVIIKKIVRKHGGGHHGGSWKVAYADFVTAMMAFFLLMWLINSLKPETKEALSQYFQQGGVLDKSGSQMLEFNPSQAMPQASPSVVPEVGDAEKAVAAELKSDLDRMIEEKLPDLKDQIIIETIGGNVRIEIVDKENNPLFGVGSPELNEKAKLILIEISKVLKGLPNLIVVEGHTDALSYSGTYYTNWELSTERASAARRTLETGGITSGRIAMVAGYASTIPFVKNNPLDPKNRRISLIVLAKGTKAAGIL